MPIESPTNTFSVNLLEFFIFWSSLEQLKKIRKLISNLQNFWSFILFEYFWEAEIHRKTECDGLTNKQTGCITIPEEKYSEKCGLKTRISLAMLIYFDSSAR
jgi:hypothetical protein